MKLNGEPSFRPPRLLVFMFSDLLTRIRPVSIYFFNIGNSKMKILFSKFSNFSLGALSGGLFRLDYPEDTPTHMMIVDIGHSQTSVSVVAFTKSKLKVCLFSI